MTLKHCFHIHLLKEKRLSVFTLNLSLRLRHAHVSRILWHNNYLGHRSICNLHKRDVET